MKYSSINKLLPFRITTCINYNLIILLLTSFNINAQNFTGSLSNDSENYGYMITEYGAKGDGVSLNTCSIQEAIDDCYKNGGGRVIIPPGKFLTGTLEMKNDIELHLKKGAVLLGSPNIEHYPEKETDYRFYGDEWVKQSLLFGYKLDNISITGHGIIDGQGSAFQVDTKIKPDRYKNRPYLIRFTECNNIRIKDITLKNSAMWMQHYLACENLYIEGIHVYNHCNKNNDMMDIDGCRNVIISNCIGDTDDDALTLKSTSPAACENVTITNCIISSHCNAIKFGTESTGGFKNISISNCIIKPSEDREVIYGFPNGISGISLEIVDGGVMDGVIISDIIMDGPEVPLFIRLGNRGRKYAATAPEPSIGSLQNIKIQNIIAKNCGKTGCSITGIPGYRIKNISLRNISLQLQGGGTASDSHQAVPEMIDSYPESTMFGTLPSSVMYIRHADQVNLAGIDVNFINPDERIHIISENVKNFHYDRIRVEDSSTLRIVEK